MMEGHGPDPAPGFPQAGRIALQSFLLANKDRKR